MAFSTHCVLFFMLTSTSALALQSGKRMRAESTGGYMEVDDSVAERLAQLESQVSRLSEQLSASTIRLTDFTKTVKSARCWCWVEYADSVLKLSHKYKPLVHGVVTTVEWKDSRPTSSRISYTVQAGKLMELEYGNATASGSIAKPTEEIARRFANVIPFASLMERIRHDFERGGMSDYICGKLIEHVESSPHGGYKAGKDWIKEFVKDNMNTALNLLRQYGRYSREGVKDSTSR
ncbi:hypothetical protein FOZ61_006071 [Perkinsus olseni]|uniref:Uncharacterized protein n=2 Tax=Perkinsus olseni TaxID=32597 RepID=A0A7J6LET5_PEROL|nr:hypothetical protein FOZ61_006071 [Perkinsus olseni]